MDFEVSRKRVDYANILCENAYRSSARGTVMQLRLQLRIQIDWVINLCQLLKPFSGQWAN